MVWLTPAPMSPPRSVPSIVAQRPSQRHKEWQSDLVLQWQQYYRPRLHRCSVRHLPPRYRRCLLQLAFLVISDTTLVTCTILGELTSGVGSVGPTKAEETLIVCRCWFRFREPLGRYRCTQSGNHHQVSQYSIRRVIIHRWKGNLSRFHRCHYMSQHTNVSNTNDGTHTNNKPL